VEDDRAYPSGVSTGSLSAMGGEPKGGWLSKGGGP